MSDAPHEEPDAIVEALRALPPLDPPDRVLRATLAAVEGARARRRWGIGLFLVTAAVALLAYVGIVVARPESEPGPTMADGSFATLDHGPSGNAAPVEAPPVSGIQANGTTGEEVTAKMPVAKPPPPQDEAEHLAGVARRDSLASEIRGGEAGDIGGQAGPAGDYRYWRDSQVAGNTKNGEVTFEDGWLARMPVGQQGQIDGNQPAGTEGDGRFAVKTDPAAATVVLGKMGYLAEDKPVDLVTATGDTTIAANDVTKTEDKIGGKEKGKDTIKDESGFDQGVVSGTFKVQLPKSEVVNGIDSADGDGEVDLQNVDNLRQEASQRELEARRQAAARLDSESAREQSEDAEKKALKATETQAHAGAANFHDDELGRDVTRDTKETGVDEDDDGKRGPAFLPPAAEVEARGYWADTYVPGDPELAWLRTSLASLPMAGERVALEDQARAVDQPFDAPTNEAIGLVLSSDTPVINGPTRMTLQIGIAGAKQAPTRRAALDVALVVDVGSVVGHDDERRLLWTIADTLVSERQAGDSFAVVVPRADGPAVLKGDALTATEVARFLGEALSAPSDDVASALNLAYETVRASSTAASEQTIGAQGVVLVTPRALDANAFAGRAHAEALSDVRLSVVGVGAHTDATGLGDIARAGQGRRWLAADAASARRALQDELTSAGKAVARALRLRIRLAPEVKFYGILGSQRLDDAARLRTKAAEEAIDRKLAETMGVAADRGEDEDGIQIVIPAFMAGDEHVILLDVEVPRPGPVLDVRARWKDLVRVGNGEAQASLAIGQLSGQAALTPSARNVRENRVALLVGNALVAAGRALENGDVAHADDLLVAARQMVGPYTNVAEARDEIALLMSYIALVRQDPNNIVTARSLAVAGRTLK